MRVKRSTQCTHILRQRRSEYLVLQLILQGFYDPFVLCNTAGHNDAVTNPDTACQPDDTGGDGIVNTVDNS